MSKMTGCLWLILVLMSQMKTEFCWHVWRRVLLLIDLLHTCWFCQKYRWWFWRWSILSSCIWPTLIWVFSVYLSQVSSGNDLFNNPEKGWKVGHFCDLALIGTQNFSQNKKNITLIQRNKKKTFFQLNKITKIQIT